MKSCDNPIIYITGEKDPLNNHSETFISDFLGVNKENGNLILEVDYIFEIHPSNKDFSQINLPPSSPKEL